MPHSADGRITSLRTGDYEIDDYYWAISEGLIPEGYYQWWGYEDAKLF